MLTIMELTVDGRISPVGIASAHPVFSWKLQSDKKNIKQVSYCVCICEGTDVIWNSGKQNTNESVYITCGAELLPHREYTVTVTVEDNYGQVALKKTEFFSGKLEENWSGKWIDSCKVNDSRNSLPPEIYHKEISLSKQPRRAILYASAMGIYEAEINDRKIGNHYFTPGYTHYQTYLQFQSYDVTEFIKQGKNEIDITVANGWFLGTIGNKNNNYGKYRGFIGELHLWFADGSYEVIGTDSRWKCSMDGPERYADFYNGQTIDNREREMQWLPVFELPNVLKLKAHYGAFVTEDQRLLPVNKTWNVYDFGQNHAGVLSITVDAPCGTAITIRHGELIDEQGKLFVKNLRKAKQTLTLICGRDGIQEFHPQFTFMGFRYAEISADKPIRVVKLESIVLTSDAKEIGKFSCSDTLLTKFQNNIAWGQRSNFIEIPTDCPQRDERMGWTGDIAVFAETAAFNRDISAFMKKWLYDLQLDQRDNGSLPVTIPEIKTYQPTPFQVPIAIWGDAATMVPWAVYRAYGNRDFLSSQYKSMKMYTMSEIRMAARFGKGKEKYLWNVNPFQYGDWCAPGEGVGAWKKKGKFLATCFLANSVSIMHKAAGELGKITDETYFAEVLENIKDAFSALCMKEYGSLNKEFQSYYVCALYFDLIPEERKKETAAHLVKMVREKNHLIQTGFAGTPYIAFALADNGYVEDAYKLIQNTDCPSWLYTVKAGGTTVWERWDALDENGHFKGADSIADMVSFNHYAYGAVGDFYYRRILGIEAITAGYGRFAVRPLPGGTLSWAEGSVDTVYGKIAVRWELVEGVFRLSVTVPANTECIVTMPGNSTHAIGSGEYEFQEDI